MIVTRRQLAATSIGATALVWPRQAYAACGVQDPGGCVDAAVYSLWYGLAALGWSLDRTLLLLAYQLDAFRWWLVDVAFTSAYEALTQVVSPLILPVATIAVLLGGLALLLLPLFGRAGLVNIRHALIWSALAPLTLATSGPLIVQLEQLRSGVGVALFDSVSTLAPGAIFGAPSDDMAAPQALYPANPCGGTALARRSAGVRLDDLAAAVVWADAEDIHCPERGGPGRDIPDRFYEAAPDGAGYAVDQDVALMEAGNDRSQAVTSMQRGAVRTFLALLPSALAVLDALVQLIFALCLVALWIGLPVGMVFVFFEQTASGVTGLVRRMLGVLQVSWSSSAVLGIVAASLLAAAELRNAAAYTGFALGGLVLTGYILTVAVDTLRGCIRTLNDTVAVATGLSITRPVELARDAVAATAAGAVGIATGGLGAGLTAMAAYQQTGSGRYAASAVLGRIRTVAQLGEVAAAMGYGDEEVTAGLYAGRRSAEGSWRGTRLQMLADARRTDPQGRTIRERTEERRITGEMARAERPTVVQELTQLAQAGRGGVEYARSGRALADLTRAGDWLPERTRAGWEQVRRSWRDIQVDVAEVAGDGAGPLGQGAALAQVLDARLRPGGPVISLDARRRVRYDMAPATLPDGAIHAPRETVRIPRLLVLGYAVHDRGDGTVTLWRREQETGDRAAKQPGRQNDERQRLLQAGALIGSAAEGQAQPNRSAAAHTSGSRDHQREGSPAGAVLAQGPSERDTPHPPGTPATAPAPEPAEARPELPAQHDITEEPHA